jgi:hypothetical protein
MDFGLTKHSFLDFVILWMVSLKWWQKLISNILGDSEISLEKKPVIGDDEKKS